MSGYIKLYRKLTQWEWYTDQSTFKLFIHCLLSANHKPKNWRGLEVETGEFVTSFERLSIETGLTIQQVRTSLEKLRKTNEIEFKATNRFSVIKVLKWCDYQVLEEEINIQNNNQITNNQQTNNKQITTNKNVKNEKKIKNKDLYKDYGEFENVQLTDEEYEKIKDQNLVHFIDRLSAYLSSTGKRYKSHYATILTWSRKEKPVTSSKRDDLLPDWFTEETPQKKELNIDRSELIKKIKG